MISAFLKTMLWNSVDKYKMVQKVLKVVYKERILLTKANGWFPVLVIRTNKLVGEGFTGSSYVFVIVIRPAKVISENEFKILLSHELRHVSQVLNSYGKHLYAYYMSKDYRMWAEIDAYVHSLKEEGNWADNEGDYKKYIVDSLFTSYKLNKSEEEIRSALKSHLEKALLNVVETEDIK